MQLLSIFNVNELYALVAQDPDVMGNEESNWNGQSNHALFIEVYCVASNL